MSDIAERVRRGAAMLDRESPGWRDRVGGDRLILRDPLLCVLGQAFGCYYDGTQSLELSHAGAVGHGFAASALLNADALALEYVCLKQAWRRELADEREVA